MMVQDAMKHLSSYRKHLPMALGYLDLLVRDAHLLESCWFWLHCQSQTSV
jgi:hypothetical protein